MDFRRPRPRDWLVGAAGAALLVSLFLDWYRAPSGATETGWQALAVNDWLIAVAAAVALGALVATLTQRTAPVPVALTALATLAAVIALVLVAVRLAWPAADGADSPARLVGVWVALAASLAQLVAGVAANRDERARLVPGEVGSPPIRRHQPPEPAPEGS